MRCWRPPAARGCTSARTPACAVSRGWRRPRAGCAGPTKTRARPRSRSASTTGVSRSMSTQGHKTGFYLDQRDNRARFAQLVRHFGVQRVLNCYCYTGGFTRRGAGRRRGTGDERRFVGAGARARACACGAQRLRCGARQLRRCRRQRVPARTAEGRRQLRRHRARSAEVRAVRGACRARRPRLQGHQPPGAEAAGPGRPVVHVLLLRAASAPSCSTRSLPAPGSMPRWTACCSIAWPAPATTRRRSASPRASTSRDW